MPQKKHKSVEIVAMLRQVEVLVSQGQSVTEAAGSIGVTQYTCRRLHQELRGLKTDHVKRLKGLEKDRAIEVPLVLAQWRVSGCGRRPPM